MQKLSWFERVFKFGLPVGMLPFYIERLEGTAVRIESKVKGISEEILSHRLDNKWSIKENIGHLAEVDEVALKRIGEIVSGISPMARAVFEPKPYHEWPITKVLKFFHETRRQNIRRYSDLRQEDLEKFSLHPRLNLVMTPVDLAWFDAEHDDHHLVRINEILTYLLR
jgi:hypothetical protein